MTLAAMGALLSLYSALMVQESGGLANLQAFATPNRSM